MHTYSHGLDALGADTNRAILIRVKNAGELARSQGGVASLAQSLAPATIEGKVYDTLRDKLFKSLQEQHVDAEVTGVEPKGFVQADGKHSWTDVGVGLLAAGGAVGLLAILWRVFAGHKVKR